MYPWKNVTESFSESQRHYKDCYLEIDEVYDEQGEACFLPRRGYTKYMSHMAVCMVLSMLRQRRLKQNYQDSLRDFYSGKTKQLMKSVEFVIHKDKFIKYLNEFVQELQRHSMRIGQILTEHRSVMEERFLREMSVSAKRF